MTTDAATTTELTSDGGTAIVMSAVIVRAIIIIIITLFVITHLCDSGGNSPDAARPPNICYNSLIKITNSRVYIVKSKVKVAHTRLPNVGFRSWSRFLAVSLQVTWVINPAVGCHYFPPGLQLPPEPLKGLLPVLLLGEQRHNGCDCEQFA